MRRIVFQPSGLHLKYSDIADYYEGVRTAIGTFYLGGSDAYIDKYAFSTPEQVIDAYKRESDEFETSTCLTVLAALEARFRIDYLARVDKKLKDPLSRAFRKLYGKHKLEMRFDDILAAWKNHVPSSAPYIEKLRTAQKYRHWLAHGRYWTPKLGRRHGFSDLYELSSGIEEAFPFERLEVPSFAT
ncbi:hypothetical protein [Pseudomonas savastanoi]|uniref:hypothetical protein n=1 Tax=Pseudomonas savastanoi TaxID=29438 RepID=UPI0004E0EDF3|nr:hypothetical protein [Pseudomonas savastanoi]KAA3534189.1 hypothetical protein DXU85_26010 [Pseudomonas savastanoi]